MEPLCAGFSFPEGRNQIGCRVAHGADCALESYAGYAFWPRCAPSLVRDLEGVHAMCFEFSAPLSLSADISNRIVCRRTPHRRPVQFSTLESSAAEVRTVRRPGSTMGGPAVPALQSQEAPSPRTDSQVSCFNLTRPTHAPI
jgi:hypothetical protein